ncbi:MAG: M20/M25/M40 family metallo-hydrolase [Planctomycetota bacterium]
MRTYSRFLSPGRCVLLTLGLAFGCQRPVAPIGESASIDRTLIGEMMMHSEFAANLRALCMPGGRLSGTPNAEAAERFVADKLREYGLKNVHFEPFDMQSWIVHETQVTLLTDPPRVIDGAIGLGKTMSTPPDGVTAELIDVGEGREADLQAHAASLPGKLVLIHPEVRSRRDRVRLAVWFGAAGVVFMGSTDQPPYIGNGHEEPRPEPIAAIPHDQAILDLLQHGEKPRLNIRLRTENWNSRPNNVVGEIPSAGPSAHEVVLIGAHLDSWHLGEGAIDNGNGSAAILEVARTLARSGWQPRRTVRFVWFAGEELDLRGSKAYIAAHRAELDDIVCLVNVDMPGAPRKLVHFGHPELEPLLKGAIADLAGYELDAEIVAANGGGSDEATFVERGVAAIALSGELGPGVKHFHNVGDKYETVDRRGTVGSAAVISVLVRRLADAPQRPAMHHTPSSTPAE